MENKFHTLVLWYIIEVANVNKKERERKEGRTEGRKKGGKDGGRFWVMLALLFLFEKSELPASLFLDFRTFIK